MPIEATVKQRINQTVIQRMTMEAIMDKPVKVYALSTCSHCKAAKRFLSDRGVSYDVTDVDLLDMAERKAVVEEVKKLNPLLTFPTIIIGDRVIVGFRENELREALEQ
jgi:glutaredoxin-like protein NrdH